MLLVTILTIELRSLLLGTPKQLVIILHSKIYGIYITNLLLPSKNINYNVNLLDEFID